MPSIYAGLAVVWVLLAVARMFDDGSSLLESWVYCAIAVGSVATAAALWRRRRIAVNAAEPAGVELMQIDEGVLARLVAAAMSDAAPDEVTPPMAGDRWGPERIEWLRRFHRDRRAGLEGPLGEPTWAVSLDGTVVGAARLKRTAGPAVLETGIWLTRSARGRGTRRSAIAAGSRTGA